MSRRRAAIKREVLPDAKFGDVVLTKLINTMMYSGKKSAAERITYEALDIIKKKTSADPLKFFHDALDNIKPFPGLCGGIVLNATWAEMQPQPTGSLTTARIDRALDQVRRYNVNHPTAPLGVKLRIFSGNQAPPWAKAIDGGPLTIQRNPQGCPSGDCPITIGKVWDRQYIAAWRSFQRSVAALYDSEPLIRSVAITSCTMETDEPFVLPVQQPVPPG